VAELLAKASEGLPHVTLLDLTDAICPDPVCRAVRDDILVWRDRHHLTPAFSRHISPRLGRELEPLISRVPAIASR
jgi:hypothetical protein